MFWMAEYNDSILILLTCVIFATMSKRSKKNRDLDYHGIIDRLKLVMKNGPVEVAKWKPWSQARLTRALGKDHATISRWFNPDPIKGNEMTITSLLSICRVMKIDPAILFQG